MNQLEEYYSLLTMIDKYISDGTEVTISDPKSTLMMGFYIANENYEDMPIDSMVNRQTDNSFDIIMTKEYSADSEIENDIASLSNLSGINIDIIYGFKQTGFLGNGYYTLSFSKISDDTNRFSLKLSALCYDALEDQILIRKIVKYYVEYKFRSDTNTRMIFGIQSQLQIIFGIVDISLLCLEYLVG